MAARAAAAEAKRDAVLASDADRDAAVRVLTDAFSVGRLSASELDERTGKVLAARTHGKLDDLLAGLGGYPVARAATIRLRPACVNHPVSHRRIVVARPSRCGLSLLGSRRANA